MMGLLIVNSYGGLIYSKIRREVFGERVSADGLIVLGSTIYTVMELLSSEGLCPERKKYRRFSLRCAWGGVTALRVPTRTLFILIHGPSLGLERIYGVCDKVYSQYTAIVLSHAYILDEQIQKRIEWE
jgi:hypothetical protein